MPDLATLPDFQSLLEAGGLKGKHRLTPEDVSEVTGAPISTVRRWPRKGHLRALRTGSRYRWILAEDLRDFLSLPGGSND
ncbi:excisionase family DNA-binding protein [Mesoterricola silvestris]|uniref:excisionase family DNA-binding protein n=1 Tax=Mesoterricola silvestris TaxID=2927979 RepID=UPI003743A87E